MPRSADSLFIRPARRGDAEDLAPRLRQEDLDEIAAGSGREPVESLRMAIGLSAVAWAAEIDGKLEALFGVAGLSALGNEGIPWMLASPVATRDRRMFVREAKRYIPLMLDLYPILRNFVHEGNRKAVRWLEHAGFEVKPAVRHGRGMFHPFEMRSSHV
jgi:hypothetical protein